MGGHDLEHDRLLCYVEIPKGSRNKYEYDEELDAIMLDRFLFSSMVYPTDYGFIPETHAEDGDPVDAKVLCVPLSDPAWNSLEELDDLPKQLQDEITHFFSVYKDLEQKKVTVEGWHSRQEAE